jgi:hypothetical protein
MYWIKGFAQRLWKTIRKHRIKASLIGLYLIASIITGTVTGRVMDADTGEPIDGAVIMAHWQWDWIPFPVPPEGGTMDLDAVSETISRRDGRFVVFRPTLLLFSYPSVTVWNEGYVTWNSKYNFNGKDKWGNDRNGYLSRYRMMVSLRPWEKSMGHCAQESFMDHRFSEASAWRKANRMSEAIDREGDLCREAGGTIEEIKRMEQEMNRQ